MYVAGQAGACYYSLGAVDVRSRNNRGGLERNMCDVDVSPPSTGQPVSPSANLPPIFRLSSAYLPPIFSLDDSQSVSVAGCYLCR